MTVINKTPRHAFMVALAWSSVLILSLFWDIYHIRQDAHFVVKQETIAYLNKDRALRLWATSHGGVYIPPDSRTPPNPYLTHLPERDVTTTGGKQLTLMNPAYVSRQIMSDYADLYGVRGHLTSLNPLRPKNAPDAWERRALTAFEKGVKELDGVFEINGESYYRLMRPLITKKGCLKCHAKQGYKEGDIRGGISVSVPMALLMKNEHENIRNHLVAHLTIWILGLTGIFVAARRIKVNISRRLKAEGALQKAYDELEEKVEGRTLELARANKKLKELDCLKSMFIASMSHELRTPLNAIIGFTGTLLQGLAGELNDKQKEHLERVHRSGEHLLALVIDVIDISKIEAGRLDFIPVSFTVNEVVEEAAETVRLQVENKGLALRVEVPTDIQLFTDRRRLLQCLLNFLSNAIKFTEQGSITVTARVLEEDVEIAVGDTGIGIAEDDLTKVFEAFERIDSHLKIKAGGAGLGLYLTKKIATELLGGNVSVESRPGEGSTFHLRIPRFPLTQVD